MNQPTPSALANREVKENIYRGVSTSIPGQIIFDGNLTIEEGPDNQVPIGVSATLALGLTECCARLGQGRVLYYARPYIGVVDEINALPMLIYMPYIWEFQGDNHFERDAWFMKTHEDRMLALNAREGNIALGQQVMPLICAPYDYSGNEPGQEYITIKFPSGNLSHAVMHYEGNELYLGWIDEMTANNLMSHHELGPSASSQGDPIKAFFQGNKADLTAFRMSSGQETVQKLYDMMKQEREGSLWIYCNIVKKSMTAYEAQEKAGGFGPDYKPMEDSDDDWNSGSRGRSLRRERH